MVGEWQKTDVQTGYQEQRFSPWGQSGSGTRSQSFCTPCPCRFSRPNYIRPWATWPHSEMILLWPGCWEQRCPKPFPPWITPWSYTFWTYSFPREWKRSPQVLLIKACNLPVPCCGSERQASLCMDMISCSCRNLLSDFHLYLKNVEETIVLKQKAEKSSAKIYFAWYIWEGRENKEKPT